MATKTDKDEISSLLGTIASKRAMIEKSPIQEVRPVEVPVDKIAKNTLKSKSVKEFKSKNVKSNKTAPSELTPGIGGRPTVKNDSVIYVKLGAKIPEFLRIKARDAINHKRFKDTQGRLITTLDELIAFSLGELVGHKDDTKK
jgi:hypothetical protein